MRVEFQSNTTKVKQLADALRQAIAQGEYKEGEMLPSINKLSAELNLARDTVFKAFQELKLSGAIQSAPTKGYYVSSSINHVLVMLDIFSPYKNKLYNALTENLSPNDRLDLYFHHYNEDHFNMIIKNSLGRYNKYVVMNLLNDVYSEVLNLLDRSKVLLIDFGKFDKSGYAYVCQGFDTTLYDCLSSSSHLFLKYEKLNFVFPIDSEHPRGGIRFFHRFCEENNLGSQLIERHIRKEDIHQGEAFLVVSHMDMIEAVKICKAKKLTLGKDVGLVTFNDAPMLEVIDNGITCISVDFREMGLLAARFINHNERLQTYIPTRLIIRGSL